jgi:hypothetical protein
MNLIPASFDRLSVPVQSLVIAAISSPLFAAFALMGDIPRGTMAWTLLGALLIALNAHREKTPFRNLLIPAMVLLILHLPLVITNPLEHAPFYGGIVTPIVLVDYCLDYAFLWLVLKIFKDR